MGDRAIVIFTDGAEVSPAIYLHWNGTEVPAWLKEHKEMMADRTGDVAYAAARFVGIAHTKITGNLSLGMWNLTPEQIDRIRGAHPSTSPETELTAMSHGDAGVALVNVNDFTWKGYGGYLEEAPAT